MSHFSIFFKLLLICCLLFGCANFTIEKYKKEQAERLIKEYPDMNVETKRGLLDGTLDYYNTEIELLTQKIEKNTRNRRENYIKEHSDIDEKTKESILNGRVFIGMNEDQVLASWGQPEKINRTINSLGEHNQWIYGSQYLYFDNGRLTSMQD